MSELSVGLLQEGITRRLHIVSCWLAIVCRQLVHVFLARGDHLLRNTETLHISWILFLTLNGS